MTKDINWDYVDSLSPLAGALGEGEEPRKPTKPSKKVDRRKKLREKVEAAAKSTTVLKVDD